MIFVQYIDIMKISKEEFRVLVMLCAANSDCQIQPEEVEVMMMKADRDSYLKVSKMFGRMKDLEVIECLTENMKTYAATEVDREQMLKDFRSVIEADEKCTAVEEYFYRAVRDILG